MKVLPYAEESATEWDEFVAGAPMATFLHTRRFLSYHGERFKDVSVMIRDEKAALIGLLPAAIDNADPERVVSHPGITYGGLLHRGKLSGEDMLKAFVSLKTHYLQRGFKMLRYHPVPIIYHQFPAADDFYALFRLGAERYRCDLSCAIDLDHRGPISDRRKRGLKKANSRGVDVGEGRSFLAPLWQVLEENLAKKFNQRPVHSIEEMLMLQELFPENIDCIVAQVDSDVVGGVILFVTPRVVHTQYIASNETGRDICALEAVFAHSIEKAKVRGARYFDFGTSNENAGQYLNSSLYRYKSGFGAGGVVHEFYEINLRRQRQDSISTCAATNHFAEPE